MASYSFRCSDCGAVLEVLMPMGSATFEDRPCPVKGCGGACGHRLAGAPAVSTSNMSNPSLDVVIGADAEKRWKNIHSRQEVRDKVRKAAGEEALKAVGRNEYRPLKGAKLRGVVIPEAAQERF